MNTRGSISKVNRAYQNILKTKPFDATSYYNLGIKYTVQQKFRAAEICYRKALWLSPHDPEIWNNLGCVYLKRMHYSQAKRCFETALKYKPDYYEALINLSKLQKSDDIIRLE